jgi:hypothetical protein
MQSKHGRLLRRRALACLSAMGCNCSTWLIDVAGRRCIQGCARLAHANERLNFRDARQLQQGRAQEEVVDAVDRTCGRVMKGLCTMQGLRLSAVWAARARENIPSAWVNVLPGSCTL